MREFTVFVVQKGNPYRIFNDNLGEYDSTKRLSLQDKIKLTLSRRDNLFVELEFSSHIR